MTDKLSETHGKLTLGTDSSQVLVVDVVQYLSGLAKLHEAERTGNIGLSTALRHLADTLRPYADAPMSAVTAGVKQTTHKDSAKRSASLPKAILPDDLESLGQDEIERILDDGNYTKEQIAEMAVQRFGISRSKLVRLRKTEARESVRAALEHEKSLDVISREARSGGKIRAAVVRQ